MAMVMSASARGHGHGGCDTVHDHHRGVHNSGMVVMALVAGNAGGKQSEREYGIAEHVDNSQDVEDIALEPR